MRTVVSFSGSGIFAQQVARAFFDCGSLEAFVTTFAYRERGAVAQILAQLPAFARDWALHEARRRAVSLVPANFVVTHPFWEVLRTLAARTNRNPMLVDRIWDHLSCDFDGFVANRYVSRAAAVYAYEYTAKATFERARAQGVATILDLPSLSASAFEAVQRVEREKFPEIRSHYDEYFDAKFERRQARRDSEIRLADVIVANSTLTKQSHIDAGADPEKIIVVPLAAPPPAQNVTAEFDPSRPLEVLWAGSFSIRKGAHYFLDAWRRLRSPLNSRARVYGPVTLPQDALSPPLNSVEFRGSVTRPELFAAFDEADVLVFPTLSDGFGMVVMEAFSRGLPVITTNRAGAADFVRHGENGLVIPAGEPSALCDAFQWCLDNRRALHDMRFAALETARRWQWSHYRPALIDALYGGLRRAGHTPTFVAAECAA